MLAQHIKQYTAFKLKEKALKCLFNEKTEHYALHYAAQELKNIAF
jgi:hypothetical protein